ncbi:hypothetical protein PMIN01_05386 [Paraphaeosphaeria minitans]|uniref:Uncharacterized protein n=1 Tax=Paraphaeosphaeria minitans TaxID=565426 RepID=A0A9P6GL27_9PLEO|nr:hypothetical protein PMIN01_05386 [Paraphaeosphaeria minitans]
MHDPFLHMFSNPHMWPQAKDWDGQMLVEILTVLHGFTRPQSWKNDRLREYVLLDPSFVEKEVAIEVAEMMYARAEVPSFGKNRRKGKPHALHMQELFKHDFSGLAVRMFNRTAVNGRVRTRMPGQLDQREASVFGHYVNLTAGLELGLRKNDDNP